MMSRPINSTYPNYLYLFLFTVIITLSGYVIAQTPEELLQQGNSAWKSGNYEEALSLFSKITTQYAETTAAPVALEGMGKILLFNSHRYQGIPEFSKIDKVLEQCISNYSTSSPAMQCRYLKIYTLTLQNQWDNAIQEASKILVSYSEDSQYKAVLAKCSYTIGFCHSQKGRWTQAIESFSNTVKTFSDQEIAADAQREIARCYYGKGDMEGARQETLKLIELFPQSRLAVEARTELEQLNDLEKICSAQSKDTVRTMAGATNLSNNLCGPIALQYILSLYGEKKSLEEVITLSNHQPQGTSFEGLAKAATQLGYDAKGYNASYQGFKKLPLPMIVQLNHWQKNHFIAVSKIKGNKIYFTDSNGENQKYNSQDFITQYTGYALVIQPKKDNHLASGGNNRLYPELSLQQMAKIWGGDDQAQNNTTCCGNGKSNPPDGNCPDCNSCPNTEGSGNASTGTKGNGSHGRGGKVATELGCNMGRENTYTNFIELSLPVKGGLSISIGHQYSSAWHYSPFMQWETPWGRSWHLNHDQFIYLSATDTAYIFKEDGDFVPLIRAGDNCFYTMEDGSEGNWANFSDYIKVKPPSGGNPYLMENRSGILYAFDTLFSSQTAVIIWYSNYAGATVHYYYGQNPSIASSYGRITAIIDDNSRGFILGYSIPFGDYTYRLTSVVDHNNRSISYSYDNLVHGALKRITWPDNYYVEYGYETTEAVNNTWAEITSIKDSYAGSTVLYFYKYQNFLYPNSDTGRRLIQVTDMFGNTADYSYSDWWTYGRVTVRDNNGNALRVSGYQFDPGKHIVQRSDYADGVSEYYVWDDHQNLTSSTTRGIDINNHWFDSLGNVTCSQDSAGNKSYFEYDTTNWYSFLTCRVDCYGNRTWYDYDTSKRLLNSAKDALGNISRFYYDVYGNQTCSIDPMGQVTHSFYDSYSQLTMLVKPDATTTLFYCDAYGNQTTIIDPMGHRTDYYFDSISRLTTIKDNQSGLTRYQYNSKGLLINVTDAKNQTSSYEYDLRNRLVKETDAANQETQYWYDRFDNVTTRLDPKGQRTWYYYNSLSWLTTRVYDSGTTVHFYYDTNGTLTSMNDPYVGMVYWKYDSLGRNTSYSNPWGTISYAYDNLGQRTGVKDPDGKLYGYVYDQVGDVLMVHNYTFDQWTQYAYDSLGRKTLEIYPNGLFTAYEYDTCACGSKVLGNKVYKPTDNFNRTSLGSNWESDLGLDNWSMVSSKLERVFNLWDMSMSIVTYAPAGDLSVSNLEATIIPLTTVSDQNGYLLYEYSFNGLFGPMFKFAGYDLAESKLKLGHMEMGGSLVVDTSLSYSWAGDYPMRLRLTVSGNTVSLWKLESSGYEKKLSYIYGSIGSGKIGLYSQAANTRFDDFVYNHATTEIARYTYNYDPDGNRTSMTDMQDKDTYYQYDSLNRLTREFRYDTPDYDLRYAYDSVGNRTRLINGTATTYYTYNNLNQLTSSTTNGADTTYAYDENGNLFDNMHYRYQWNEENFMTGVQDSITYTPIVDYIYDSFGNRFQRIHYDEDGKTDYQTRYYFDGINILMEQTKVANGNWQTSDSYTLGSGVVGHIISDHLANGTDLFYHYDPIGNVLMISNASGDTIASYCQEGFGNVKQTIGSADNNYHLTTKEIDSDTGLYYFYARWYDPEIGRFINEDKIRSINYYNYVYNNSVNISDPEGNHPTNSEMFKDCGCKGNCCDWIRCLLNKMKDKPNYGEPYQPKSGNKFKPGDLVCWGSELSFCDKCANSSGPPGSGHIGIIVGSYGTAYSCRTGMDNDPQNKTRDPGEPFIHIPDSETGLPMNPNKLHPPTAPSIILPVK
jgi:RHS repeat-associated protein